MPTWGELLQELNELRVELQQQEEANPGIQLPMPVDLLRRKYMNALAERTGRSVIVYSTAWMEGRPGVGNDAVSIQLGDQQGFMEACSNLTDSRDLDLFLHSPGGSAEAADAIMAYLRTQFDHIRAIVPLAAMSAATMMALACDEIVMGDHSQLGPIDPQFTIFTPEGPRSAPGQAIEDQFERAKEECANPTNIAAWLPILRSYAPGLLAMCDHQQRLAEDFAAKALAEHMFQGQDGAEEKAKSVAAWFADFKEFRSHGRRVWQSRGAGAGTRRQAPGGRRRPARCNSQRPPRHPTHVHQHAYRKDRREPQGPSMDSNGGWWPDPRRRPRSGLTGSLIDGVPTS